MASQISFRLATLSKQYFLVKLYTAIQSGLIFDGTGAKESKGLEQIARTHLSCSFMHSTENTRPCIIAHFTSSC